MLEEHAQDIPAHFKMGIYVYTGNGAGKTTSALGLAMRSIGQGQKVVMIQFMKFWKNTGEYKIQKKLGKMFRVYQFGRHAWLKISENEAKFDSEKFKVAEENEKDRELALKGLKKAEEVLKKEKPKLLILDEINLALSSGLLKMQEVLDLLDKAKGSNIVLTGRNAPKEIIERADFVNEVSAVKYPEHMKLEKGIQY